MRTYLGIGPTRILFSVLPVSFDYGLNQLLTAVEQGAACILLNLRFGDDVVRAIERHRVTGLAGVPTLWALLTRAAPSLRRADLSSLRYLTNSGGALPVETVRRLREALPRTEIVLMYGLTGGVPLHLPAARRIDRRPGSMGRAIPETEVFAVNAEGRRTRPGEPGILMHRGPTSPSATGTGRRTPPDASCLIRAIRETASSAGRAISWSRMRTATSRSSAATTR